MNWGVMWQIVMWRRVVCWIEEWCAELRGDVLNWGVMWQIEEWCDELSIINEGAIWWRRECNRATQNRQTSNRTKSWQQLGACTHTHTAKCITSKLRHAKNTHQQFHTKSSGQSFLQLAIKNGWCPIPVGTHNLNSHQYLNSLKAIHTVIEPRKFTTKEEDRFESEPIAGTLLLTSQICY